VKLDEHTLRLIAVGASITANCQPCLQVNVQHAVGCGVGADEIAQAIEVGKRVRQGAASKMDAFAAGLDRQEERATACSDQVCGCGL
jgi:AhpD family alkylhydroperoxidase